jgi:hypothetical protein
MGLFSLPDQHPAESSSSEIRPSASVSRRTSTPGGEPSAQASLTASLPPPNTKRWVIRRKAAVVAAVRSGGITLEEACHRYQLSEEELHSWERVFEIHGLAGLRTTRIQQYRAPRSARPRRRS